MDNKPDIYKYGIYFDWSQVMKIEIEGGRILELRVLIFVDKIGIGPEIEGTIEKVVPFVRINLTEEIYPLTFPIEIRGKQYNITDEKSLLESTKD